MSQEIKTHEHVLPLRTYLGVAFALFILTAVTVGVSLIQLGGWNAIVAVGVASVKALLVALIFMHLKYDKKIYLVIFVVAMTILTVFIALTMFDTLRRGDIHFESEGQIHDAVIYTMPDSTADSLMQDSIVDSADMQEAEAGH
jgi:caa(3)-type oxidase subunit IV